MAQYSVERKQAILNKLLSPELISIAQLGVGTEFGPYRAVSTFV